MKAISTIVLTKGFPRSKLSIVELLILISEVISDRDIAGSLLTIVIGQEQVAIEVVVVLLLHLSPRRLRF